MIRTSRHLNRDRCAAIGLTGYSHDIAAHGDRGNAGIAGGSGDRARRRLA